jgi:hypothetical protein
VQLQSTDYTRVTLLHAAPPEGWIDIKRFLKSAGKAGGTIVAPGAPAFGWLMTTGVGISKADAMQSEGSYRVARPVRTPVRA